MLKHLRYVLNSAEKKKIAHCLRFLLYLDPPYSAVTENELALLLNYSRRAEVIVEIGCFEGKTSVALARNTSGIVYSIDPFFSGRLRISYAKWIARIHARKHKVRNLRFVEGLSFDVVRDFHQEIDFLFIDGDHNYDVAKRDWEDWLPKMRNQGIIALHDCIQAINSPHRLGSQRLYEQDIPKFKEVHELASTDSLVILQVDR